MKEITIKDKKIKLKKDYLTKAESEGIIAYAMEQFNSKGIIDNIKYNYLALENSFFDALFLVCVEDYDDDMREDFFNNELRESIMYQIKNAEYTYTMLYTIAEKSTGLGNVISMLLEQLLNTLPTNDAIVDFVNNIPELQDAIKKYNDIIGNNQEGE